MARCDFAEWTPITANYRQGGMMPIRGFIPHVQVGYGELQAFFSNPATQASAHFWISTQGRLCQLVDTDDMAWAEAAGNPYFISCEFEGQVDEPMTSQQLDMGGRLIAWVYNNVGQFPLVVNTSPDGNGITPHFAGGAAWGNHSCPGPLRFQQYDELLLAALRYMDQTPQEDEVDQGYLDAIVEIRDNVRKLTAIETAAQASGGTIDVDALAAKLSATLGADVAKALGAKLAG